jgi:hypothetical protein
MMMCIDPFHSFTHVVAPCPQVYRQVAGRTLSEINIFVYT